MESVDKLPKFRFGFAGSNLAAAASQARRSASFYLRLASWVVLVSEVSVTVTGSGGGVVAIV